LTTTSRPTIRFALLAVVLVSCADFRTEDLSLEVLFSLALGSGDWEVGTEGEKPVRFPETAWLGYGYAVIPDPHNNRVLVLTDKGERRFMADASLLGKDTFENTRLVACDGAGRCYAQVTRYAARTNGEPFVETRIAILSPEGKLERLAGREDGSPFGYVEDLWPVENGDYFVVTREGEEGQDWIVDRYAASGELRLRLVRDQLGASLPQQPELVSEIETIAFGGRGGDRMVVNVPFSMNDRLRFRRLFLVDSKSGTEIGEITRLRDPVDTLLGMHGEDAYVWHIQKEGRIRLRVIDNEGGTRANRRMNPAEGGGARGALRLSPEGIVYSDVVTQGELRFVCWR
jgi:hypothetical protein